ncbi:MAG: ATP-binding protein, partial [Candidatus Peribacteraceae bacterium]|nr:ATP-binding protein [Candidatus Peribacteraceae bacterium]
MFLDKKPLEDFTLEDMQQLVDDQISEVTSIEYKSALQVITGDEKREFLNDVSSFANTKGGYLIFGIEEKGSMPTNVKGIKSEDPDAEIRRLDNLIRDKITPRIPGIYIKEIPVSSGRYCIVLKIQQSWLKPHMVDMGSNKFFTRNSKGKHPLNYQEIKVAFDLSGDAKDRIEMFRANRITEIITGNTTPIQMGNGPKTILHLVPLSMSDTSIAFDVRQIAKSIRQNENMFIASLAHSHERYNLDGYM